jgi:Holliday junction resolvase RusA-like endonuclease
VIPTSLDVDNVAKALLDGCNGVLWSDDSQIYDVWMRKQFSATPGLWVTVVRTPVPTKAPK